MGQDGDRRSGGTERKKEGEEECDEECCQEARGEEASVASRKGETRTCTQPLTETPQADTAFAFLPSSMAANASSIGALSVGRTARATSRPSSRKISVGHSFTR